jgi:hypothetical protein
MRLQLGIRTATVLGLALLWAAPAMADHDHRKENRRPRKAQHVQMHHHGRYRPVAFTHFVHGHPVRVVMHQPYYCAACRSHFRRENAFHNHLHRQHRLARRSLWRHLVRVGWGWAYFG